MSYLESDWGVEDAVHVHIVGRRRPSAAARGGWEIAQDNLSQNFLRWLMEHPEIESYPLGSSGLGNYVGVFPAEHKAVLERWFEDQQPVDEDEIDFTPGAASPLSGQ